jgi:aspartyl-tRNA(Asn)/glutamyl-tRNA(Gln) amidotransferase subunit A
VDFRRQSVTDLAGLVRAGEVKATELVEAALERIEADNATLNAFVAVDPAAALAAARLVDERRRQGDDPGPLAGIPIGVKDLEDAAGFVTTHGSLLHARRDPAIGDSPLVARLKDAGCVVVGKTNTPEFGWQPQTDNPVFGITHNPWDHERTPGGSSGGSAAAVSAGLVPLATGSDGGGSIRIPAALCGLSGFKPSLGRVPGGGPLPPAWGPLTSAAPMARTTADIAAALDAVIGPDPTDLQSLPMPEASWQGSVENPHVPMRVAWSPTLGYASVDQSVRAVCEHAVKVLADLGAEVVELESVFEADPFGPWRTMSDAYLLRSLSEAYGSELWNRVTPRLAVQLERAASATAVELVQAEDECHLLNLRLVELFHDVRLLATPTVATTAPRCGEPGYVNGQATWGWVQFTYPFNLTRSPAGTVCAGLTDDGLPVGLQLVGPQHADLVVLRAMTALEQTLGIPMPPDVAGPESLAR